MIEIIKLCNFDSLKDELRGSYTMEIIETIIKNQKTKEFMQLLEEEQSEPIHIIELTENLWENKENLFKKLSIIEEED